MIESGNPVERVDVNNIDKWVLTVPGCEMMQMVTHLKHLSVHTLSNRTDIRVSITFLTFVCNAGKLKEKYNCQC